jgi:NAD-dependent dihydropyrimidine dehydrogenase PreA subunit
MTYRHIIIHVASGTGNSLSVARWMAAGFSDLGAVGISQIVEGAIPIPPADGDEALVAIIYPTHGFTAPWAVFAYVCRLPRRRGTHAIVVPTRAAMKVGNLITPGLEGSGPVLLALILWLKGYRVRGWRGVDMPSNWLTLHWGMRRDNAEAVGMRAQRQLQGIVARLRARSRVFSLGSAIQLALGMLLLPVSLGYMVMGRFLLAKLLVASTRCNGCRSCSERCPHGAIRWWSGRPYWSFSCASCMRCMAYCPQQAVEAGYVLLVPYVLLMGPLFWWLLSATTPRIPGWGDIMAHEPVVIVMHVGFSVFAIGLAYAVLWLLMRIRLFNILVTRTTPTHWWRRSHAPGINVEDLEAPGP